VSIDRLCFERGEFDLTKNSTEPLNVNVVLEFLIKGPIKTLSDFLFL
jgi:hypothetical protein